MSYVTRSEVYDSTGKCVGWTFRPIDMGDVVFNDGTCLAFVSWYGCLARCENSKGHIEQGVTEHYGKPPSPSPSLYWQDGDDGAGYLRGAE